MGLGKGARGRKEDGEGSLEGLGNGLDMVNKTVKSKMTEGSLPDWAVITTINRK